MPEGWVIDAMVARVLAAGMCKYPDLVDGTLTLYDFFAMLRVVDWIDYTKQITAQQQE